MNIKEIRELVNKWYKPYSDKPEALLVFNAILDHIAALSERVDLYWTQHGVKLQTLAERLEKLETRTNTASSSSSNYNNRLQDFERRLRAIEKDSPVIAPFTWTLEAVDAFNKMKPEQNPPIIHDDSCRCKRCAERYTDPPKFEGYEYLRYDNRANEKEYILIEGLKMDKAPVSAFVFCHGPLKKYYHIYRKVEPDPDPRALDVEIGRLLGHIEWFGGQASYNLKHYSTDDTAAIKAFWESGGVSIQNEGRGRIALEWSDRSVTLAEFTPRNICLEIVEHGKKGGK